MEKTELPAGIFPPTKVAGALLILPRMEVKKTPDGTFLATMRWQAGRRRGTIQGIGLTPIEACSDAWDSLAMKEDVSYE